MLKKIDKKLYKERKSRAEKLFKKLRGLFPNARIMLRYKNPWELLVAVILSAQCTIRK
jgi:endonuclease III